MKKQALFMTLVLNFVVITVKAEDAIVLYKDYTNSILVAWNWSFFPIDMLISISGLNTIRLYRKNSNLWVFFALGSLFLTFCSGLMAISFWIFHNDFDLAWWIPNLFLLIYPIFYLNKLYEILTL
jgi:hypothetical protein